MCDTYICDAVGEFYAKDALGYSLDTTYEAANTTLLVQAHFRQFADGLFHWALEVTNLHAQFEAAITSKGTSTSEAQAVFDIDDILRGWCL